MSEKNKVDCFTYDNSKEEFNKTLIDNERRKFGESWLKTDTLNFWRHARIREPFIPLIRNDLNVSWVKKADYNVKLLPENPYN